MFVLYNILKIICVVVCEKRLQKISFNIDWVTDILSYINWHFQTHYLCYWGLNIHRNYPIKVWIINYNYTEKSLDVRYNFHLTKTMYRVNFVSITKSGFLRPNYRSVCDLKVKLIGSATKIISWDIPWITKSDDISHSNNTSLLSPTLFKIIPSNIIKSCKLRSWR